MKVKFFYYAFVRILVLSTVVMGVVSIVHAG